EPVPGATRHAAEESQLVRIQPESARARQVAQAGGDRRREEPGISSGAAATSAPGACVHSTSVLTTAHAGATHISRANSGRPEASACVALSIVVHSSRR